MANIPNIIIDTDPGQDDAAAILFGFGLQNQQKANILALTCVAGNVPLPLTVKNARIVCDWADKKNTPIYAGAEKPINKALFTAEEVHGENGLAGVALHEPQTPVQEQSAILFLIELLKSVPPKSITLCPIGPLTNIAQAILQAPECRQGIKEIVIMGGCFFEPGNINGKVDFNFYVDPKAADIVVQSGVPITIIPLDVTHKACLSKARLQALRDLPNENGKRLADILSCYEKYDMKKLGLSGGPLHDPVAIAYCIYPEIFKGKNVYLEIEQFGETMAGASKVDWWGTGGKRPNVRWINQIDDKAFFQYFNEAIATLP